jgi:hypothetical protein
MLGSAAFTLAMSARATSSSAGFGRMATAWRQSSLPLRGWLSSHDFVAQFRVRTLH